MDMASSDVQARLRFLKRAEIYKTEKPWGLNYDFDNWPTGVARGNFVRDDVENIWISDLRGKEHQFTFKQHGFAVLEMHSSMAYEDFSSPKKVEEIYCAELSSCLLEYLGATHIQIFDTQIRRRHPLFSERGVKLNMPSQPADRVHIDASQRAIINMVNELNEGSKEELIYKPFLYLNVWRPLKGPVFDWPLAVCEPSSIDALNDLEYHDQVFPKDTSRENMMLHYSKDQRWHYLSAQMPSELLLMRQCDSQDTIGVPHTAFPLPPQPGADRPGLRESIEVRVIAYFDGATSKKKASM